MPALSSKLRAARKAAGLTQGQVSACLGITRGAVTHRESDEQPEGSGFRHPARARPTPGAHLAVVRTTREAADYLTECP